MRPMDEAISTAGGVPFEALDERLMLKPLPGVFCQWPGGWAGDVGVAPPLIVPTLCVGMPPGTLCVPL
ncbi:hypothetical protein TX25_09260 [Pseudomonas lactis]|uniref:Uncharacterized protein n=1 Tax=Pseudomonas azotoformans TaxID=47878 RepID=A0A4Q0HUP3_PSEAZ|nr:hypothetical protein TX25_09260 [Pseudomonas lactis]RXE53023.1 hypothetical protein B4O85_10655 [Pseudomonas azotoformans]